MKFTSSHLRKLLLVLVSLITTLTLVDLWFEKSVENSDYKKKIMEARKQKDHLFKNSKESPLTEYQKSIFRELAYFEAQENYRIKARIEIATLPESIYMNTSKNMRRRYVKYAKAYFEIEGKSLIMNILKSTDPLSSDRIFIPFTDETNGVSSYGGGRYIDQINLRSEIVTIDFNLAYNPYCAYNAAYECPIPPLENHIALSIEAGEKKFNNK